MLQNCNPCTPETAGRGKFYMNVTSFLWQNVKFAIHYGVKIGLNGVKFVLG